MANSGQTLEKEMESAGPLLEVDTVKAPIHGITLANDLWEQAVSGINVDLKFVCGAGIDVYAHRAVVAAHHAAWNDVLSLDGADENAATVVVLDPEFDGQQLLAEIHSLYFNNMACHLPENPDARHFPILNQAGSPSASAGNKKPVCQTAASAATADEAAPEKPISRGRIQKMALRRPLNKKCFDKDVTARFRQIARDMPWLSADKGGRRRKNLKDDSEEEDVDEMIRKVDRVVEEIIYDGSGTNAVGTLTVKKDGHKKCKVCGVSKSANEMKDHLKIHFMDKFKNPCKHCDLVFPSMAKLEAHKQRVHDEKFKCKKCPSSVPSFVNPDAMELHVKEFHYEGTFKCGICFKEFYSADSYHNHVKSHIKLDPVTKRSRCPFCFKTFNCRKGMVHIMIHMDPESYKFRCDYCHQKFYNLHKRIEHENVAHTGALTYVCDKCHRGFATSARRAVHKKRCNGEDVLTVRLSKNRPKGARKKTKVKKGRKVKRVVKEEEENQNLVEFTANHHIQLPTQHHVVYQTFQPAAGTTIQFTDFYG